MNFTGIRNRLLHGYSISTIDGKHSDLKKKLSEKKLIAHINDFKYIMKGMSFFVRCLDTSDSGFTEAGKEQYIDVYLNYDFLLSESEK